MYVSSVGENLPGRERKCNQILNRLSYKPIANWLTYSEKHTFERKIVFSRNEGV